MIKSNKGFTLIEVLVAFVVLIIVSASLMQAFVVSARLNRRAYDTDKATALATRIQEVFRRDTSKFKDGKINYLEANVPEMYGADATPSAAQNVIIQHLDKDWQPTNEAGWAYEVNATVIYGSKGTGDNSYYPDYYKLWNITPGDAVYNSDSIETVNYDLTITETLNEKKEPIALYATLTQTGSSTEILSTNININNTAGNLVLVIGDSGKVIKTKVNINVYNNTKTYNDSVSAKPRGIDLYVLDAPDENQIFNTKTGKNEQPAVTVVIKEGFAKYSILASRDTDDLTDTMNVTITRKDGTVLAQSSVTGYYKYDANSGA